MEEEKVHHFNKTGRKFRGKIALRRHKGQIRRNTKRTKTNDKKPISSRIQGRVMNAKTKGLEM